MSTVVVKVGGHSLESDSQIDAVLDSLAPDLLAIRSRGEHVVLVHGGGPQILQLLSALGIESKFVDGLRVSDRATVNVVAMALGQINARLVAGLNARGVSASGLAGPDGEAVRAVASGGPLEFVGEKLDVNANVVSDRLRHGVVVLNPIATDGAGQLLNCNGDEAAGAVAAAMNAVALVLLSDVDQVRTDPSDPATAVAHLTRAEAMALMASGAIRDGMRPKVAAALTALAAGASRVVIANAEQSLLKVLDGAAPCTQVVA